MSAISDFAAKQTVYNDRLDTAVTDLTGDIKSLNETITALQESAGTVTPEDQALIDQLVDKSQVLVNRVEALSALTPPVLPAGAGK